MLLKCVLLCNEPSGIWCDVHCATEHRQLRAESSMYWTGSIAVAMKEPRFSDRLLTFDRHWLDHCCSTDSAQEDFVLTAAELAAGIAIQVSFSLLCSQLAAEWHGALWPSTSRSYLGHLVMSLSILKEDGLPLRHSQRL